MGRGTGGSKWVPSIDLLKKIYLVKERERKNKKPNAIFLIF